MSITSVGTLGSGFDKTSSASATVFTTAADIPAGGVVVASLATNVLAVTGGQNTNDHTSLTIGGVPMTKIKEGRNADGSTLVNGQTISIWQMRTPTAIGSGAAVVATAASATTVKVCSAWLFSTTSGYGVRLRNDDANDVKAFFRAANNTEGNQTVGIAASGSVEHIAIRTGSLAGATLTPTYTSGWTPMTVRSSGTGGTNQTLYGEFKIENTITSTSTFNGGGLSGYRGEYMLYLIEIPAGISSVGSIGSGMNKTIATTTATVMTTTAPVIAGNWVLLALATDNVGLTSAVDTNEHTGLTVGGQAATKLKEYRYSPSSTKMIGVTLSFWLLKATSAIATGAAVVYTGSGTIDAKSCTAWQFMVASGRDIVPRSGAGDVVSRGSSVDTAAMVLGSGPTTQHLAIRGEGIEWPTILNIVPTAGWTQYNATATTGSGNTTNVFAWVEFKIEETATSTSTMNAQNSTFNRAEIGLVLEESAPPVMTKVVSVV